MRRGMAALLVLLIALPMAAQAQSMSIDLGHPGDAGTTARIVQIVALFTILAVAPSLIMMVTAFTRIVVVLSLLRAAIGAQGTPPNTVVIGLALFLTAFVMQPAMLRAWQEGIKPMSDGGVTEMEGLVRAAEPFRAFMVANARPVDLELFSTIGHIKPAGDRARPDWRVLIPAFMVGELRRAFEMGFVLYLPFVIIDLVVSSVLMSLGMMMLPPGGISLPFKLIFFVMVDGWRMVAGSLAQSFPPY
jgi:flagellar biosynthetic protein FliP